MPEIHIGAPVICPRCGKIQTEPYRLTKQRGPFEVSETQNRDGIVVRQNVTNKTEHEEGNAYDTVDIHPQHVLPKNTDQHQPKSKNAMAPETKKVADAGRLPPHAPVPADKPIDPEETQVSSNPYRQDATKHSPVQNVKPENPGQGHENRFANADRKPGSSHGSGAGSGSGSKSRIANLDLSERVMGTISKSSEPIPAADTSQDTHGIHRVVKHCARGGMGRILIVFDPFLKRNVALKELHPEVAEDISIVRRFIGEAEITAQLEHPGIVPIHTLNRDREGLPYYTMKLIKGKTYQEVIKDYHKSPTMDELIELIRRLITVCRTIGFAHTKGVIHRDLKPANIMLGEHGETLVMDWGLAKPIDLLRQEEDDLSYASPEIEHHAGQTRPELTVVGAVVGTPAFMSPEQASPESYAVGPLSDIFSLGTILYYLLTGQTAFSGRSTQEVLAKVRAASPIPPSEIKPNVPAGLEAICAKAMAKKPADRYQSTAEMVKDLGCWLDNKPVLALKEGIRHRFIRWMDRYRSYFIAIPFIIILLIVFVQLGIYIDKTDRVRLENETIRAVIDGTVDLTNYPSVKFTGSHGLIIRHELRKMTGDKMISCSCEQVPESGHAVVTITAPGGSSWNLSKRTHFQFSVYEEIGKNQTREDAPLNTLTIKMGRGSSYFEYTPEPDWWAARKIRNWQTFSVLLDESAEWKKVPTGFPDEHDVAWIELHFSVKTPISFQIDNVSLRNDND